MKVQIIFKDKELLSFDSTAVAGELFGQALTNAVLALYTKWKAEVPPQDHKLIISEK